MGYYEQQHGTPSDPRGPSEHKRLDAGQPKPGIIGRERALIDKLTKRLHNQTGLQYRTTRVRDISRGSYFEVIVADERWIARVEVTLDRVEEQPVGE